MKFLYKINHNLLLNYKSQLVIITSSNELKDRQQSVHAL
nr:MAG TPA: hypothetical protein [Bacteriophage sp.]